MFSELEGLADKHNPLNLQAEGRREGRKEGRREENFKECKSVPRFLEKGHRKWSLLSSSCHLKQTAFTSATAPHAKFTGLVLRHGCRKSYSQEDTGVRGVTPQCLIRCYLLYLPGCSHHCKDANSIFIYKGGTISKPQELSTLAFYHCFKRPLRAIRGFRWFGGCLLLNIGPYDDSAWGLREVSHSQQAVIEESSSFFSTREGWGTLN